MSDTMPPASGKPREETIEMSREEIAEPTQVLDDEPATQLLESSQATQLLGSEDNQVWSAQSTQTHAVAATEEAPKQIRFLTLIWGVVLAAAGLWGVLLACGVAISTIAASATIFAAAGILLLIAALRGIRKPATES